MNEEKFPGAGEGETPAVEPAPATLPEAEAPAAMREDAAPVQEAPEAAESTAEIPAEAESPAPVQWRFGSAPDSDKTPKKSGQKGFFAIFASVFGVCILLLVAVLCLGDGSFQFIRNLHTERVIYVREDDGTSGLLTPNEAADKVGKSTVSVVVTTETGAGIGSGFVYRADGYICTNYHVIEKATAVQVVLQNGKAYDAAVVGQNALADLAVLKIDAPDLTAVELGSSADLLVGDAVVAVGTPAKLDYAGTATFGTVSHTNRLVTFSDSSGTVTKKMSVIQTDTSVNPGNSGGPLADMYGKVVGVVVMKVTNYGGTNFEGVGFALPIDGVKLIVDAIIKDGVFEGVNPIAEGRSLLGLTGHGGQKGMWYSDTPDENGSMTASEIQQPGYHYMSVQGVYVLEVSGQNVAGKVRVGDIVTRVNGLNVTATTDLIAAVNRHHVGETVTLTLVRDGETLHVDIVLYEG